MNERLAKIIRAQRWIFYAVAALLLAVFALDFMDGSSRRLEAVWGGVAQVGDATLLIFALIFCVVFAALLVEFVRRELAGAANRSDLGEVVLEISRPVLVTRFIVPMATLVLVLLLNLIVFQPGRLSIDITTVTLAEKLLFWLFYGIGHFLFVAFSLRAVRNQPYFVLTKKGLLYEPGDMSPGLIRWDDIASVEEAELLQSAGSNAGPRLGAALIVTLKDAAKYNRRYNPLLRGLLAVLMPVIRYQAGGKGDIVVAADDFGARYEEVKALIRRYAGQ